MKKYIFGIFVLLGMIAFYSPSFGQTNKEIKDKFDKIEEEFKELKRTLVLEDAVEKIVAKKLQERKDSISQKSGIDSLKNSIRELKKTRVESIESDFSWYKGFSYTVIIGILIVFLILLFFVKGNIAKEIKTVYLVGGGVLFILIILTFAMNRLYVADIMQSQLNNLIEEREVLRNTNLEGQTYDKVISLDNKMEAYKLELQRQNDRIEILAWVLGGTTFFALLVGLYEFIVGIRSRLNEVNNNLENTLNKKVAEEIAPKIEEIARNNPKVFAEAMAKIDEELKLKTEMKIQVLTWKDNRKPLEEYFKNMNFNDVKYTEIDLDDNEILINELTGLEKKKNDKSIEITDQEKKDFDTKKEELKSILKNKKLIDEVDSKGIVFFNDSSKNHFNIFNTITILFKDKTNVDIKEYAFFYFNDKGVRFNVYDVYSSFANSFPSLYNNLIDLMRYKKNVIDNEK